MDSEALEEDSEGLGKDSAEGLEGQGQEDGTDDSEGEEGPESCGGPPPRSPRADLLWRKYAVILVILVVQIKGPCNAWQFCKRTVLLSKFVQITFSRRWFQLQLQIPHHLVYTMIR